MEYQRLYQRITEQMRPGDPAVTAADVSARFACSESHARSVMDWMANEQQPPTMAQFFGASPMQWRRV